MALGSTNKGPRCLRCMSSKKGCDRKQPICSRCKAAGLPPEACISEDSEAAKQARPPRRSQRRSVVLKVSSPQQKTAESDAASDSEPEYGTSTLNEPSTQREGSGLPSRAYSSDAASTAPYFGQTTRRRPGNIPPYLSDDANAAAAADAQTPTSVSDFEDSMEISAPSPDQVLHEDQNQSQSPPAMRTQVQSRYEMTRPTSDSTQPQIMEHPIDDALAGLPFGWEILTGPNGVQYFRNQATGALSMRYPSHDAFAPSTPAAPPPFWPYPYSSPSIELVTQDGTAQIVTRGNPRSGSIFNTAMGPPFITPSPQVPLAFPTAMPPPFPSQDLDQQTFPVEVEEEAPPLALTSSPLTFITPTRNANDDLNVGPQGAESTLPTSTNRMNRDAAVGRPLTIDQALSYADKIHRAEKTGDIAGVRALRSVDADVLKNAASVMEEAAAAKSGYNPTGDGVVDQEMEDSAVML